jgi:beta-RFAP synthase
LLSLPGVERWQNLHGEPVLPARRFGSVGLMVHSPGVQLTATPAPSWSAEGPLAARALAYSRQIADSRPPAVLGPFHLTVEYAAPEHMGLGTGTQLGLAVARALSAASGLGQLGAVELASLAGRGLRSALGIHGFAHGGFLVDAGKDTTEEVAPLVVRVAFPETWRLVLVLARWAEGLHGAAEREAFRQLENHPMAPATTEALCRLVLLGMLPALSACDWQTFGEAVYDFNARVGAAFAPVQGGNYAHPRIAELVAWGRRQGIAGVGQSSWGPAVFALARDEDQAAHLAGRIRETFALGLDEVLVTQGCNVGARTHFLH